MRRVLFPAVLALWACDDTIPGLCKVDSDCSEIHRSYCYNGVCLVEEDDAGDGGDESPGDAGSADAGPGALGTACAKATQCASGFCVDGVCCDAPCNDKVCQRCDGYSVSGAGHCGFTQQGNDLDHECDPATSDCSGTCLIRTTAASCPGTSYTCVKQVTYAAVPSGQVCASSKNQIVSVSKTDYCATGNDCADAACHAALWWTSCDGLGHCRAASDKTDAFVQTILAPAGSTLTSSCGTSDGSLCSTSLHCSADAIFSGLLCDGAGQCAANPSTPATACGDYGCNSAAMTCKTQCSADADCARDLLCKAPVCHWNWEWANWSMSPPAAKKLTVSGDALEVADNVTGLVWQRGLSDASMNWSGAKSYCANLASAGGGWRLPTVVELLSIVDFTRLNPAIDTSAFSLGSSSAAGDWFWTSSPYAGSSGYAWAIHFGSGMSVNYAASAANWVRCVR